MKETLSKERDYFWEEVQMLQRTEGFPRLTQEQQSFILLSLYFPDTLTHQDSCHLAIQTLEEGIADRTRQENFPSDFFKAEFIPVFNQTEATQILEAFSFPCVVHIQRRNHSILREQPQHTFLALGHNNCSDIVIWEKEGLTLPFRLTTLDSELDRYGPGKFWGLRKLRCP